MSKTVQKDQRKCYYTLCPQGNTYQGLGGPLVREHIISWTNNDRIGVLFSIGGGSTVLQIQLKIFDDSSGLFDPLVLFYFYFSHVFSIDCLPLN